MKNETTTHNGPEYWMSLEHLAGGEEFAKRAENEFQSSPYATDEDGFARRDFLKLMGASLAMATTACVRRPVQKIIPYAIAPKEVTPGIANFYASTWFDGTEGYGALVRTLEGRPVKMEGNPLHPMNLGGLTARAHAEVLSVYDPDRLTGPVRNLQNKERTNRETISAKWEDLDKAIVTELQKGSVAILSSTLPSPSTKAIIGDFSRAFGGARWVQYDTQGADQVRKANGGSLPRYRLDKARMVVTIDADILGTYLSPAEFMKQWSQAKKPGADMIRMVAFESMMTLTGMNADDRYIIKPSQQLGVVFGLINGVSKASKGAGVPAGAQEYLKQFDQVQGHEFFAKLGAELWANRGKSVVIAGGLQTMTEDSAELQAAVAVLNSILGADGQTLDHSSNFLTRQGSAEDLQALIADMNAGKVKTLVIHNLNPAYSLPADSGFAEALSKVPFVVSTANRNDETAKYANYVLPAGTSLESWGDFELQSGVYSIQQPTLRPLHDSRSFEESLLAWTKAGKGGGRAASSEDWFAYVQGTWKEIQGRSNEGKGLSFDDFWNMVLQKGVVTSGNRDVSGGGRTTASLSTKARTAKTGYELVLYPTVQLGDGHYANIAWMQELPDPVTKIVWDNYVSIAPATAAKEHLKQGDVVTLKVGTKRLKVPVHVQPGVHEDVMALAIGYGRTGAGKVAKGIGADAFQLAAWNNGQPIFAGQAVTFEKSGERYRLVSTQDHHILSADIGERQLSVDTTKAAYLQNPSAGIHRHKVFSIWPQHQYTKHKWAMAIDLNVCTGCSACVVACQSENNVPVVGKKYVMDGREMHWMRIDRYYKGSMDRPEAVFQPMLCQHCETAPCETVCPVLATAHNDEGLNDMTYNRCVGTRYCSNNCPYKVRRFNWFNYSKREAPTHMALNPDVTVRSRGVMEKCTMCVHRIRAATKAGKEAREGGKLKDLSLKTACQETCPTNAITFGDLNDKDSAVAKLMVDPRQYALLEDLNTQPRVRYMSRVRNAERAMVGHGAGGHEGEDVKKESHDGGHGAVTPPMKTSPTAVQQGEHV